MALASAPVDFGDASYDALSDVVTVPVKIDGELYRAMTERGEWSGCEAITIRRRRDGSHDLVLTDDGDLTSLRTARA